MGKGILGPVLSEIPLPRADGRPLVLRDGTNVPGVTCETHHMDMADPLARRAFIELFRRPEGVDACRDCLLDFIANAKAR